jgi:hypothetical protein
MLALGWLVTMTEILKSWQTAARDRLLTFVADVTQPTSQHYVPPSDRIATFDHDGTLWVEKPYYTQLAFLLERLQQLAPQHPEWRSQDPYRVALSKDLARLKQLKIPAILELAAATHTGMTQTEFVAHVQTFLQTARHPRFGQPFTQLVYQPMVELIQYLQQQQFQVYLCSAGGLDFMRVFTESVYGIPPEHVMGSSIQKRFTMTEQGVVFQRQPELVQPINDRAAKPVLIDRHVGKRPILAAGNADGDLAMLQYVTANEGPALAIVVRHDDPEREYAYDEGAEQVQAIARRQDWLTVSMKADFNVIFPANTHS